MRQTIYKSMDEFRSSDLFQRIIGDTPAKVNVRILLSTLLETMIYTDLRTKVSAGLDEIEAEGSAKLSTFPALVQDLFQAFYSLNPRRSDTETLTATARQFNAEIIDFIMSSDKYHILKSSCEGRELPAYEAIREFAECMLDKLDELLNTDSGGNAAKAIDALKQQCEQLKTDILDAIESGDLAAEDSILSMAAAHAGKEQQMERLSEMISQNIGKNKDGIQSAVASAAQKAQEVSDVIKAWGNGENNPTALKQNAELLRRVQNSTKLREIVKYLGRYLELLDNARKSSYSFGRGDKYDIVLGNDFTRAISSEYAYLALPETVSLFIQKVQRKNLKQYRKRERVTKGHGDVVVCIDESGSMAGDPIAWAKAVALALLEYATQNKRSCAIVRFASANSIVTHIYKPGNYTTDDIFKFAESFLCGGTNFEAPLKKAVALIKRESFENADIVFITDGACAVSDKFTEFFRDKSKQLKFKVTGIVIDSDIPGMDFSLTPFCEQVYRLSELTGDDVAADIIKRKYR